jgi:hypothetical protein
VKISLILAGDMPSHVGDIPGTVASNVCPWVSPFDPYHRLDDVDKCPSF